MTAVSSNSLDSNIYLYATRYKTDGGTFAVDPQCLEKTKELAEARSGKANVIPLEDSSQLAKLKGEKNGCLLVPGGNLRALMPDMEKSASIVKEYVANGGGYLGICSGGMTACNSMRIRKADNTYSITEDNMLRLVPIDCYLPVSSIPLGKMNSDGGDNGREVIIMNTGSNSPTYRAFWNEGGALKKSQANVEGYQVVSFYLPYEYPYTMEAAAVRCPSGNGRVGIFQFHPEIEFSEGRWATKKKEEAKEDSKSSENSSEDTSDNAGSRSTRPAETSRELSHKTFHGMLDYTLKIDKKS